jgi:hypothetical protein
MKRIPVFSLVLLVLMAIAWWHPAEIFAQSSTPYGGEPWSIPGIIEAEDFDVGGEGLAYHDADSANQGGLYRPGEGVDIGKSEDGAGSQYLVDWTGSGEWLQYTVEVMHTGTYNIIIREGLVDYATGVGAFHLEMDGADITGSLQTYQGVFWWQGYSTVTVPNVQLVEGTHKLRLVLDSESSVGVGSFNWILFELVSPKSEPLPVVYPEPDPSNAFYVSPNGDDGDPGSISQPWKTLAKAAETATAGQTIFVREGTYNERLIPQNSGDLDAYIIFTAYPGESVTIDGMGVTIPQLEGLVNIGSKRFIRVSGFHVINAGDGVVDGKWNMGISAQKADHIIIDNNDIDHIYSLGIDIGPASNFIIVDNNEVTDTNFGDVDDEVSVGMFWFSHDVEIKNNTVHDTKNEGIGAAAGTHDIAIHHNTVRNVGLGSQRVGIYIDAWTEYQYNIDVYNNLVYDNAGQGIIAASEGGGLLENVNIYNNVVHNSGYDWGGIGVAPWSTTSSTTHPIRSINFVNNTVYACNGGGIVINNPEVENILIRNNVLYQSGQPLNIDSSVPQSQLTIDHNLTNDPQFMDAATNDFRLQATSPAIDAGSADGAPAFDFDDKNRPVGYSYDVGAYEYGDGGPAEKLSQTISFATLPARTLGDPPFTVNTTSSSGLPVSLASQTPAVCTVNDKTITLVAIGTCVIVASQAGNTAYAAAAEVTRSFTVRDAAVQYPDEVYLPQMSR